VNKEKHSIYTSSNVIELYTNRESGYSNEETAINTGFGFEIISFQGVMLFKRLAISVGVGISFNVNEDFKSLPVVGDLKFYLNPYGLNSLYVLLNAGRNINVDSFLPGGTAKFGIGYTFESDFKFSYVIEAFVKSREYIINTETNYNYQVTGLGLALGIKF
jgi:hypothetical protein